MTDNISDNDQTPVGSITASNIPSSEPPSQPTPTPARKRRRWPVIIAVVFFGLIILGAGGFFTASALEEHDTFCISCHMVPETTYYNRAYMSLDNPTDVITDLATAHYHIAQEKNQPTFKCIDCHRGDSSLIHRISTLALGGRDAVIYVLGKEDPTIEKTLISESYLPNAACVSCHTDTLLSLRGLDNHFHTHLPQAAEALAKGGKLTVPENLKSREEGLIKEGLQPVKTSLVCTDCHQPHKTVPNSAESYFIDNEVLDKACDKCHEDAGQVGID
jgi:nitrate/TMAO reductase-like tetraheme cytochrome c subunit